MSELISRAEVMNIIQEELSLRCGHEADIALFSVKKKVSELPTAFDTKKVVEQLNNVLQDLNVIEVIDHIVFDSTIQTSLENFLNAFKSEIMRIVKNNACIDELLKGEEG